MTLQSGGFKIFVSYKDGKSFNKNYDVVVVGAGPTGAVASRTASRYRARTLLVEEHGEIGTPVRCAGLISKKSFQALSLSKDTIIREIYGALIYAPNGQYVSIGGGQTRAYVVDRKKLDIDLVKKATEEGVQLRTGAKAVDRDNKRLVLTVDDKMVNINVPVVIGADGPFSQTAKWANLPPPRKYIYGIQAVLEAEPRRSGFVEGYLSNQIAPGFFGWVIPYHKGFVLAGLGTVSSYRQSLRKLLDDFLNYRFSMHIDQVEGLTSGPIPIGYAKRTAADGILVAGDAAGQAKPTSGGGIYTGTACARIAGEIAAKYALNGGLSPGFLKNYETRWKKALGKELNFGFKAHQLLSYLNDEDLNRIIGIINEPEIIEIINSYGDMDYPSKLILKLLKISKVWQGLFSLVPKRVAEMVSSY